MTDAQQRLVWRAEYSSFGKAKVTSAKVTLNLRLPGQYFDAETGTHYNYFRDYDPKVGRYLTSDPIGLMAGVNTYAYVRGDPMTSIDPLGLGQCFYSITSGKMICYSDFPNQSGFIGIFASGNNSIPGCKNNPKCMADKNVGPIPTGSWYWDEGGKTSKPGGRVLVPVEIDARNRDNIRTHICANPFGPSKNAPYCSEGCVTGKAGTIKELNDFLDREWKSSVSNTLQVYE